jgi:hypothetical protein
MQLISTASSSVKSGNYGDFEITATMVRGSMGKPGWRLTTIDRHSGLQHEFFVQDGRIHLVQFRSSPPWDHSTGFIIGGQVRRISHAERQAIVQALAGRSI